MRVEKVGASILAMAVTWRLPDSGGGEEEGEEGEGVDNPAKHWWWWLPLLKKLGGQLPAG